MKQSDLLSNMNTLLSSFKKHSRITNPRFNFMEEMMNQSEIVKNNSYNWKIDYRKISMVAGVPLLVAGIIDRSSFVLMLCVYVAFISAFHTKYHWMELTEKSVRYIKSKENILKYEYDESFEDRLNSKEIDFEDIKEVKLAFWGSVIVLKLTDGNSIRIEMLSKSKDFKREILSKLEKPMINC